MKKILRFLSIFLAALFVMSCSENDPAQIYGWDDPADISGPRMLKKVLVNNQTEEEYFPDAGNLYKVERKLFNGNAIEQNQTLYVSFLGTKLAKVEIFGNIPGNTSPGKAVLTPNYDNAGKLVSLMNDFYESGVHKKHSVTIYNYNADGKIINAYQKTANVNPATPNVYVYPNITNDIITYDANNIAKVQSSKQVVNLQSGLIESEVKTTYEYSGFDWRINPYTTIHDNYLTVISSLFPEMYVNLSENNPGKLKLKLGTAPAVETTFNYSYDTHNYPTNNGYRKFTYQPAP